MEKESQYKSSLMNDKEEKLRSSSKNLVLQSGMPRIPERYNQLSIQHRQRMQEIIDANFKKAHERIIEEARQEKEKNNKQKEVVLLSAVDMKPVQPYLKLIPLKEMAYFQLAGKNLSSSVDKK